MNYCCSTKVYFLSRIAFCQSTLALSWVTVLIVAARVGRPSWTRCTLSLTVQALPINGSEEVAAFLVSFYENNNSSGDAAGYGTWKLPLSVCVSVSNGTNSYSRMVEILEGAGSGLQRGRDLSEDEAFNWPVLQWHFGRNGRPVT